MSFTTNQTSFRNTSPPFHWNLKTIAHLHFRYHLVHDHVVRLLFFSKHTLVSPYCMHSLLILTAFWFASVIVFYYYPVFFLCPLCSNPPHRLFITLIRIAWIASGEGIRLLVVEANSSWKVQPLKVEMSALLGSRSGSSLLIPQTTNILRILNFFPIWILLKFTNQKIWSVYVQCNNHVLQIHIYDRLFTPLK